MSDNDSSASSEPHENHKKKIRARTARPQPKKAPMTAEQKEKNQLDREDIEVNLFDKALALGKGKLRGDGNKAPSGPQNAEGVRDVVRPVRAQESDARARQALDERAEAGGKRGAFFIQFRVGGFTSVVKNGDSAGVGFFENLLGDVHFENAAAAFPAASARWASR